MAIFGTKKYIWKSRPWSFLSDFLFGGMIEGLNFLYRNFLNVCWGVPSPFKLVVQCIAVAKIGLSSLGYSGPVSQRHANLGCCNMQFHVVCVILFKYLRYLRLCSFVLFTSGSRTYTLRIRGKVGSSTSTPTRACMCRSPLFGDSSASSCCCMVGLPLFYATV